ncbi:MAG: HNH endonuclease [SAR324 cluster bacterium]|uniref:HNH endonuclease n=1 Tax=SAR324 cluster bacterium TaxID=2024889 RepID=A0A432GYT0_9DELT|nr:MAG: HNH endonuclease [SAR324 cluster bacterium]
MQDVLLLNQDGNPLTLWPLSTLSWQQAIKALYLDKVTVLRSYDDWICHSQHLALPVPSVVMMARYHQQQGTVNFTRRNIFLRDRFHCQYCLHQFSADHLTIDHVIPKSQGGGMRWKNVVAACHKCNLSKGANIVHPSQTPFEPNYWQMVKIAKTLHIKIPHSSWQEYLQWPNHLVKIDQAKAA